MKILNDRTFATTSNVASAVAARVPKQNGVRLYLYFNILLD